MPGKVQTGADGYRAAVYRVGRHVPGKDSDLFDLQWYVLLISLLIRIS